MSAALPVSEVRRLFEQAVDSVRSAGVEGALLVSRHGVPLAGAAGVANVEEFAAMHATALGAAEVAFARLGGHTAVSLIAETDGRRFVSRAIGPLTFVVAVVRPDADCRPVLAWMATLERTLR